MKVLYVEDDLEAQAFVGRALRESGFVVDLADDGASGLDLAIGGGHDVIVLDVRLPDMDGFEVLRTLRSRDHETPVIFLSAQGEVTDRIEGLNLGADDYLTKPFAFAELLARIRAIERRLLRTTSNGVMCVADLELDIERQAVRRSGQAIHLTPKEFQLLEYLMRNTSYVVSRTMIAEKIWGQGFDNYSNAIDVHVNNLRRKIDRDFEPKLIHTRKGLGYVVEDRSPASEAD